MKIRHVIIHNFRSIQHADLDCRDIMVLLGQNNHGKSNVLRAIEFALATGAKLEPTDLFAFSGSDDREIWVEIEFGDLTEQEQTTFRRYLRSDKTFKFRKNAKLESDKLETSYNGYFKAPSEEWLVLSNASNYTNRKAVNQTPLKDLVPQAGRLSKDAIEEAQQKYIEENLQKLTFREQLEDGPLLGQKNVAVGVLPDFFIVPAVRDLADESKVKNTALFGKLLSLAITEMSNTDTRLKDIQGQLRDLLGYLNATGEDESKRPEQLRTLENSIEEELSDWDVKVSVEVTPPDINRIFELGTDIHLDDGHRTLAERKGHGLQRAVIFGLIKAWAKAVRRTNSSEEDTSSRKASESVIFAVEEPELFLHPHAQRTLDAALRQLANSPNNQVFLCSHSTHFVNLDDYRGIALVRKSEASKSTGIVQCKHDLFEGEESKDRKDRFHMASWVNPDRGEMLFARRVVFVEGETEKTLLPFAAQKLGYFSQGISIIDCGSKFNLPLYVEIAKAFSIDYIVIHDKDPVEDGLEDDKFSSAKRTFGLNSTICQAVGDSSRILMFAPDVEGSLGISGKNSKKGKALAALDWINGLDVDSVPEALRSAVRKIYQ